MSAKIKLLAAACALAAGNAFALDITNSANTPAVTLYITGSSALQNDIANAVNNGLCATGSLDMYKDNEGGGNFLYFLCTAKSSLAEAGQTIAVAYRTQGGSAYGTGPVGTAVVGHYQPSFTAGGADGCPSTGPFTAGATAAKSGAACTGWLNGANSVTTDIPDVGVSDEEPVVFQANTINQPASCTSEGDTSCPSWTTSNFTSTPVLVQAMGLVATQPLIDAMVAAGSGATNANGYPTANFNRQWVTEMFGANGKVLQHGANWSKFFSLVSGATGNASTANGPVVLCRRAAGSGTEAALAAHFFDQACNAPNSNTQVVVTASGFQANITKTGTAVPAAGVTGSALYVIDNSSSGAVKTCMATASANGYMALGVLSFDQSTVPGNAGGLGQYDFVSIDGVPINDGHVTNGAYWNVVESTMQTSSSIASNKADLASTLQAQLKTVTTASANGVYSLAGATGAASSKVMNFTTSGHTCAPAIN